ncbi:CD209 antigen-like protein E [Acipenser oxyrinchus oxyrinchus]|uniref:CD209 antigen-like protein E n=1 Tax=Acipenser oxyrinchus oxyrinchus TaxID=40147 RepID=A0AAD8FNB7_ACIOX|nr:CD209 antigen-like protein E [Acipenser oxyrinchus oxyrinchus]
MADEIGTMSPDVQSCSTGYRPVLASEDPAQNRPSRCLYWTLLLLLVVDVCLLISALVYLPGLLGEQLDLKKQISDLTKTAEASYSNATEHHNETRTRLRAMDSNISSCREAVINVSNSLSDSGLQNATEVYKMYIRDFCSKKALEKVDTCSPCPLDWRQTGRSCYMFSDQQKTWTDSQSFCQSKQSTLLIINNAKEQQDIISKKNLSWYYWIGLSDRVKEGDFRWVDDTSINTTEQFWEDDQPDDWQSNEDCIHLYYDGLWNDISCDTQLYFICEKETRMIFF